MPAAPKNKIKLSREGVRLVVLLGDKTGAAPTVADEVAYLKPLSIQRCASGSRVNVCVLAYDLGETGEHVVDTLTPKGISRQAEVWEVDVVTGALTKPWFWGKLASQPVDLGEGESIQYVIRIDKHLFGEPLGKIPFWSAAEEEDEEIIELDRPLVFNPEIDDKIQKNKSDKQWEDRGDMSAFFDAAAIVTEAAQVYHDQVTDFWRVYEAAHALCWLCNPDETFVTNPTRADCFLQLGEIDETHQVLRNLDVKAGRRLPELLDELLTPVAASWTVDLAAGDDDDVARTIRFFRRNEGTQRTLFLQRPGERLDPAKSFLPRLSVNYDVSTLANKVIGCTSRKLREITVELKKGWPVSDDTVDRDRIEKEVDYDNLHPHAVRKWILGEHGAWIGLRPEITEVYDLSPIFDDDPTLPTCRKFLPCLSRAVSGDNDKLESRGIVVEWWNTALVSPAWEKVTWTFSNLQLECGIFFSDIPKELYDQLQDDPENCRIRVTATIEGDTCVEATAEKEDSSPNGDEITVRLDFADRFHSRKVYSNSQFYTSRATADEADDLIPLQAEVERIRGVEDAAELACSALLEGLDHYEYQIGDLITKVDGRNIELIRNTPALFATKRYLQIMGINYDIQAQRTELLLESTDEEQL